MKAKRYDWVKIRDEYIVGDDSVTLEALSRKHGCHMSRLKARCSAETWVERRVQHRDRVSTKVLARAADFEASHRAEMIRQAQEMQKLGMLSLERHLANIQHDPEAAIEVEQTRLLLKDGAEMIRRALGIPESVDVREYERLTNDERAVRIAALLDRVRARRDGSVVDGEG